MKIVRDGKAYVQKKDLAMLMQASLYYGASIPNEVIDKVFKDDIFIVGIEDSKDYISFCEMESIKFFEKLPYIIDYDRVSSLSVKEINELIKNTMESENSICEVFQHQSDIEKKSNQNDVIIGIDLLENRFYDLRDILWEKQAHEKIKMPYELTIGYKLKMIFKRNKNK